MNNGRPTLARERELASRDLSCDIRPTQFEGAGIDNDYRKGSRQVLLSTTTQACQRAAEYSAKHQGA